MAHFQRFPSVAVSLCLAKSGAPGPIRTADTRFRRAVLCPLSYGGALEGWLYDFFEELAELLLPDEPSAANSTARLTLPLMFDMVMVLLAP